MAIVWNSETVAQSEVTAQTGIVRQTKTYAVRANQRRGTRHINSAMAARTKQVIIPDKTLVANSPLK
jgi:hypothetical protein